LKPAVFLRDERARLARRHLVGIKVIGWGALIGGTLKSLDFPAWFVLSLLIVMVLIGTTVAGAWSELLPVGFELTRRGRERTLKALLKLEEAIVLAEGGIQAFMDSMRDTGRPPSSDGPFQRIGRAGELVGEVTGAFTRAGRLRTWLEILSTGWAGMWRMLRVIADAQRIGRLAQEAVDLLKSASGAQGGPSPVLEVLPFRRRAESISRELAEVLVSVQHAREDASREDEARAV